MRIFIRGKAVKNAMVRDTAAGKCITEFLDLTDEIKEMILSERPLSEIRYRAVTGGDDHVEAVGVAEGARWRDDPARDQPCHL